MKLRRINALRWVDEETGTYFQFFSEHTEKQAIEQAEIHLRWQVSVHGAEAVHGTDIVCPRMGKPSPPPEPPPNP